MIDLKIIIISAIVALTFNGIQEHVTLKQKQVSHAVYSDKLSDRLAHIIVFCVHLVVFYALINYFFL